MFDKRNRWITILVMAVGIFAFVGISVIVPFTGALQQNQRPGAPSPSPSASPSQADLEAQARGYELVLQREPDNQTALRGLVEVRIQQGQIEAVLAPLERLAALNPDQPDYTVLLAQTKQRLGDREGAAQAYRSILATRPGDLNALKGLTDLMIAEQRPEAAIGLLQDTLNTADEANQVQPGSIDVTSVQLLLGEVFASQGRYDEAITQFDRAIASNKQDFRPVLGKAIVLKTQGKNEEAQPLFASAAALAPTQYKDQINQLATATPSPADAAASPAPEASPAELPTEPSEPSSDAPAAE
ncbi:MAG: tetratricopeptide repeat protein [Synechococcales cyanobacterium C42_A2020_086]|nr:tetratricopeptide repeat protein [Synechococcales cyanobacterium M58_A2018_015]MBF2074107.1 tetratricopeptide repeat protein [Synechococcales cyanobacterium C42_A2020_086]